MLEKLEDFRNENTEEVKIMNSLVNQAKLVKARNK